MCKPTLNNMRSRSEPSTQESKNLNLNLELKKSTIKDSSEINQTSLNSWKTKSQSLAAPRLKNQESLEHNLEPLRMLIIWHQAFIQAQAAFLELDYPHLNTQDLQELNTEHQALLELALMELQVLLEHMESLDWADKYHMVHQAQQEQQELQEQQEWPEAQHTEQDQDIKDHQTVEVEARAEADINLTSANTQKEVTEYPERFCYWFISI